MRLGKCLRYAHPAVFVIALTAMSYIPTLLWLFVEDGLGVPDISWVPVPDIADYGAGILFFLTVVFAPLFETLVFQTFFYFILSKIPYFRRHRGWIVLISAMVFGANHFYSLFYIVWAGMVGALFMWGYIIRRYRKGFWLIVATHALINLIAFVYQLIF